MAVESRIKRGGFSKRKVLYYLASKRKWVEYDKLHDQAEEKLSVFSQDSTPPVQTNASKLRVFIKQMETLKHEIKSKVENLSLRTSKSNETTDESPQITLDSHKACTKMLSGVKDLLSNRFVELSDHIIALDDKHLDDLELFRQQQLLHVEG